MIMHGKTSLRLHYWRHVVSRPRLALFNVRPTSSYGDCCEHCPSSAILTPMLLPSNNITIHTDIQISNDSVYEITHTKKMDVMLQRHHAKHIYVIPDGLKELMSDISREVLRSHPVNIYLFIADYLDALFITRENARVAMRMVDSVTEIGSTIAELLLETGMCRKDADRIVRTLQKTLRKYLQDKKHDQPRLIVDEEVEKSKVVEMALDEAKVDSELAEQAATIIQNAWYDYRDRVMREKGLVLGMVDWRVAARSTMRLYKTTGATIDEANRAATLIKAAYKGYYTRRVMKRVLEEKLNVGEQVVMEVYLDDVRGEDEAKFAGEGYEEYSYRDG